MKTHREGRKGVLTPEQVQWVTSIDTLQSMVHLSLIKRAMIIRDRFNLDLRCDDSQKVLHQVEGQIHLTELHVLEELRREELPEGEAAGVRVAAWDSHT